MRPQAKDTRSPRSCKRQRPLCGALASTAAHAGLQDQEKERARGFKAQLWPFAKTALEHLMRAREMGSLKEGREAEVGLRAWGPQGQCP